MPPPPTPLTHSTVWPPRVATQLKGGVSKPLNCKAGLGLLAGSGPGVFSCLATLSCRTARLAGKVSGVFSCLATLSCRTARLAGKALGVFSCLATLSCRTARLAGKVSGVFSCLATLSCRTARLAGRAPGVFSSGHSELLNAGLKEYHPERPVFCQLPNKGGNFTCRTFKTRPAERVLPCLPCMMPSLCRTLPPWSAERGTPCWNQSNSFLDQQWLCLTRLGMFVKLTSYPCNGSKVHGHFSSKPRQLAAQPALLAISKSQARVRLLQVSGTECLLLHVASA